MGYRHSRDEMLDAAVAVVGEVGLGGLTFARVAERLGTSDRMVVYYFPTKADLVTAVVTALGGQLQVVLAEAFGSDPHDVDDLVARAWPVLATEAADRVFAVFFELVGAASAGQEPAATLAPALLEAWVAWLEPRVTGATPDERRARALATVARVDGLLLVRRLLGPDAADAAVRAQLDG